MTVILIGSVALAIGGPGLAVGTVLVAALSGRWRRRLRRHPIRPVLMVLMVELRAGRSTLAALQAAAKVFPDDRQLVVASRTAMVNGLTAAVEECQGPVRALIAQLARAQRSGSAVAEAVRSLLEADITADRARRVERARSLPVRLMIPIALLVLPGLVLLIYGPSLLRTFADLAGPLS